MYVGKTTFGKKIVCAARVSVNNSESYFSHVEGISGARSTYLMVGSGDPPELEQERLSSLPSCDCACEPGVSTGARGLVSTVSVCP